MSWKVKEPKGTGFKIPETGVVSATLCMLIDLGMQTTNYEGQVGQKHQVWVAFELGDGTRDDGLPFVLGKKITLSFHEKSTLYGIVKGIFPQMTDEDFDDFDLTSIVGMPCLVTVSHYTSNQGYVKAKLENTVTALPKGMKPPQLISEPLVYNLDNPDKSIFDRLPDWLQGLIPASGSTKGVSFTPPVSQEHDIDDDVIF